MSQNNLPENEEESVGNGLDVVMFVAKNVFIKYEVLIYFVICNSKTQNNTNYAYSKIVVITSNHLPILQIAWASAFADPEL